MNEPSDPNPPRTPERAVRTPRTDEARLDDSLPASSSQGIARPEAVGPVPEFEDEPPGSYLRELGVGRWNVVWGAITAGAAVFVAIASTLDVGDAWGPLLVGTSRLVPLSSAALLVVTGWQQMSPYTARTTGRARTAALLAVAALVIWFFWGREPA